MGLPRVPFVVRRVMLAVVVVAIAFGDEMTRRRSVSYRDKANRCALIKASWRAGGETWDRTATERKKHLRELEA
jgi:hypothetical protein